MLLTVLLEYLSNTKPHRGKLYRDYLPGDWSKPSVSLDGAFSTTLANVPTQYLSVTLMIKLIPVQFLTTHTHTQ